MRGILGRILSHCNCPPTNKAPMTAGTRRVEAPRPRWRTLIRPLLRVHCKVTPRAVLAVCVGALIALSPMTAQHAQAAYAIAQYGNPKYPPDFKHFDYVNPDAPRGGTLVLANPDRSTSFDKFNPFTMRGSAAPGIGLLFESLTTGSADEVASAYGLLANDIRIAPDGMST